MQEPGHEQHGVVAYGRDGGKCDTHGGAGPLTSICEKNTSYRGSVLFRRTTRNPRVSTHDNITVAHGTLAVTVGSGTGAVVLPGGRPAAFEFLRFPVRVSHCRGRDQGVLRFQLPPIEPCMQFSRTRLTDVVHRVALPEGRQTAGGTPGLASTVGREHGARSPTCQAIRATVTVSYYLAVTAGIAGRSS
jgi:hypothetical protein